MIRNKTYQSLLGSIDCFAENKSVVHFKNLVWCLRNNSLKDTSGTWAMVGTILARSSSDIEMYLCHHDWDIMKVFGDLHHFVFHSFLIWLYFLVCRASPLSFTEMGLLT